MKEITKTYVKMNAATKASIWLVFCSVLQKGIQFVFTPVLTRLLTTEQYGEYNVFWSWYEVLSIFATLNLSYYVINNGMVKYKNDREGFVSSLQLLGILSTVICFIVYFIFQKTWYRITGLSYFVMIPMFIEFLLKPSFDLYSQRLKFDYNYKPILLMTVVLWILIPAISVILILIMQERGLAAIYGRLIGFLIISIVSFILIRRRGRAGIDFVYWKYALRFNLPLIPHFLSGIVLITADRIMIERLFTNVEAGIYSLAYSVATVSQIVNTGIHSSFIPYTYKELKANRINNIKRIANFLVVLIAVLNLLIILIAPELIKILGTEEYQVAIYSIPVITISGLFIFMFNLCVNIEYYFEENKFVPIASLIAAVLNIVLNYVAMKWFGYLAAGYTTLITYILYALGHYYFMRRTVKKNLHMKSIYDDKVIWTIASIAVVLSFLEQLLYNYWILRYGLFIVIIIAAFSQKKRLLDIFCLIRNKS